MVGWRALLTGISVVEPDTEAKAMSASPLSKLQATKRRKKGRYAIAGL